MLQSTQDMFIKEATNIIMKDLKKQGVIVMKNDDILKDAIINITKKYDDIINNESIL